MSRGGANNFAPPPPWQPSEVYDGYHPLDNDSWNHTTQPVYPRFVPPYRPTQDEWWPLQERVITRPSGLIRFPPPPLPPMQIVHLNTLNQRTRPSSRRNVPPLLPTTRDDSPSVPTEQQKALNQLKKEIYNPTPKRMIQRVNLYYRDNKTETHIGNRCQDTEDDGKRCAICLDDFEPRQAVTVTPCKHMFHEECIVPWVKSHGQCPVCRFVISEQVRQSASTSSNNNVNVVGEDPFVGELVSVIRAMEEALEWRRRGFH